MQTAFHAPMAGTLETENSSQHIDLFFDTGSQGKTCILSIISFLYQIVINIINTCYRTNIV